MIEYGEIMKVIIRKEEKHDERIVEEITKRAFWNLHEVGCNEHYLVHLMRNHQDFIKELDLVIEVDNEIVGNIMFTKSHVIDEDGNKTETVTFGPVSIEPEYQRKGFGSLLIEETIKRLKEREENAIIIYGHPGNYVKYGFIGSKKLLITNGEGRYPCGLLVLPLKKGIWGDKKRIFKESEVYSINMDNFKEFDQSFEQINEEYRPSQEEFYILSNAYLD
jgi:putative acetyltransferase